MSRQTLEERSQDAETAVTDPDARAYQLLCMRGRAQDLMYSILLTDEGPDKAELVAAYDEIRARIRRAEAILERAA